MVDPPGVYLARTGRKRNEPLVQCAASEGLPCAACSSPETGARLGRHRRGGVAGGVGGGSRGGARPRLAAAQRHVPAASHSRRRAQPALAVPPLVLMTPVQFTFTCIKHDASSVAAPTLTRLPFTTIILATIYLSELP